jgi:hypothetical protein
MAFWLIRMVSNAFIFMQGYYCSKAANDALANLVTFDIQQNAVGSFRKLSNSNALLKKKLMIFISLQFVFLLLSVVFLNYLLNDILKAAVKKEFKDEEKFDH